MINTEGLRGVRETLAADGYDIEVRERDGRLRVTILATPEACADCLVPKPLMAAILRDALGLPQDAIDLTYPDETYPDGTYPDEVADGG